MAAAEVNWGRWVVRCPRCPSAQQVTPGDKGFRCDDCEAVDLILWPAPDMIRGVARLLGMRRDPSKQNWLPYETLDDLMVENGTHDVFPDVGELPPGVAALTVINGARIVNDRLPLPPARQMEALG
jgi:hypothetical protein